jgi:hypothetical protein
MQQEPLGQRSSFWIVHTKSHNDRHSAALATRSTPEGDPPNRLGTGNSAATTSLGRRKWSRGRSPPWSVTAIPGQKFIDDREMQRRFDTDEVIRREFDAEHDLPFPEWIGKLVLNGMLIVEGDENEPLP